MSIQYKVIGVLLILMATFAAGRYSAQKPATNTTTNTVTHETEHQNQHEVIVTIKAPDGTTRTTETIDTNTQVQEAQDTKTQQIVVPPKTNTLNVSVLVGNDFSKLSIQPLYGVSVSKQLLGPLTVGAFGLTNGVIGVSIGLNF
jgi:hypothetical protein